MALAGREPEPEPEWHGSGTCTCFRREKDRATCGNATFVEVIERFIGISPLTREQVMRDISRYMLRHSNGVSISIARMGSMASSEQQISPTLLEEWDIGHTNMLDTVEYVGEILRSDKNQSSCGWEDMCFCATSKVCKLHTSWRELPPLSIGRYDSEPDTPRRMDMVTPKLAKSERTKVRIVFGMQVPTSVELLGEADPSDTWEFLPHFDLREPWSQRNILAFCTDAPTTLRISRQWCWMEQFREYMLRRTGSFPCRPNEFQEMALKFIASGTSSTKGTRYLWVLGGEVKALYVSMEMDVSKDSDAGTALQYKAHWDRYVDEWNAQASQTAEGAFHVSELWVEAERAGELMVSVLQTLIILFTLAFAAMFVFTGSVALSVYVVISAIGVVCGLCFFIVIVRGWKVGLIEVIAMIYFIGYALDYSLHIAYKYRSPDALDEGTARASTVAGVGLLTKEQRGQIRYDRTVFAIRSIGGAVVGSALTTAGASFFLVFCNLTLFNKLGWMCLAVTVFSVFIALGPLPAGLFIFGPSEPGCRCWRRRRWSFAAGEGQRCGERANSK